MTKWGCLIQLKMYKHMKEDKHSTVEEGLAPPESLGQNGLNGRSKPLPYKMDLDRGLICKYPS